jgi:predicted dehydrogenase
VPRYYGSYEELLRDAEIEAVYVPLPNHLHLEWSVRALEADKHVLCEKPLCLTAADVVTLQTARDRSGRHIEEAFAYRNHPQWTRIRELLASGTIGKVRAVQCTLAKQFLDPNDIRNNPDQGGGALYDLGSYAVNACSAAFQRAPDRVIAAVDRDPVFKIDRLSTALLDYGDGHASFTVGTQSGPSDWAAHQQFSALGSTGWLRCDFPYAHGRPTPCNVYVGDRGSHGAVETMAYSFEPVNQYTLQVDRFSRYVRGDAVPSWPIEDSLLTLRIIEALFASARDSRWESIDG